MYQKTKITKVKNNVRTNTVLETKDIRGKQMKSKRRVFPLTYLRSSCESTGVQWKARHPRSTMAAGRRWLMLYW